MFIQFLCSVLLFNYVINAQSSTRRTTYSCSNTDVVQEPITSLLVITSVTSAPSCPAPYERINQDLNQGAGGSYIYTCVIRGDPSTRYGVPLSDLSVTTGATFKNLCPAGTVRIGQDLNMGAGGDFTYFCTSRFGSKAITDITYVTNSGSCPSGYEKSSFNLNSNTGSSTSIYMCIEKKCDLKINSPRSLSFRSDGTFKITQFTDSHHGESYANDIKTQTLIYGPIIRSEDPDLIALSGDQVSGGSAVSAGGSFRESYNRILDTILSLGYPYFYTNGNHDPEGDLNQIQIAEADLELGGSVTFTQVGPANITGSTNYYLPVYASNSTVNVGASIWVFDSNQYTCDGVSSGWGCIGKSQVQWYEETAAILKNQYGGALPNALAYYHIPVDEYLEVNEVSNADPTSCQGRNDEAVCCPHGTNSGVFQSWLNVGDITATFVGHDHDNDFGFNYQGIYLYYGRKSGYGGYGPPTGWQRGSRVVVIKEGVRGVAETWIRQEDGSRMDLSDCANIPTQTSCC